MNFIAYAIYNQHGAKIYIGHTSNLTNRLKRHNGQLPTKKTSYTNKNKGKWLVIYTEESPNRDIAIKKEVQLKNSRVDGL